MPPKPRPEIVNHYADMFSELGAIETKRMFGGWQFRCQGEQFAIAIHDTLFFRTDAALRADLEAAGSQPFRYTRSGKEIVVSGYQSAPESDLDDVDALLAWARQAMRIG